MTTDDERPWTFEPVPGAPDGALDGPAWDGTSLWLCRPATNEILRYDPATTTTERVRHSTSANGGLAIAGDGRMYGAQARSRRVVWYAPDGTTYYLASMIDGQRQGEPQDLAVGPDGALWITDDWTADSVVGPVGFPPPERGSVLRLTRVAETDDGIGDWRLERTSADAHHPRGIAVSTDGGTIVVSDRGGDDEAPTIRSYPIQGDGLGAGTVLHRFDVADEDAVVDPATTEDAPAAVASGPAGLTVATDGRILVAVGDRTDGSGPSILVLDPDGTVIARHAFPTGTPTHLAFGGKSGEDLYVTATSGLWRTSDGVARMPGR